MTVGLFVVPLSHEYFAGAAEVLLGSAIHFTRATHLGLYLSFHIL